MADLQELQLRYRKTGWDIAIGSSGTIKAVEEICRQQGWIEKDINADALHMLRERMLEFDTIDSVRLPGLTERRHPVLIGGLLMLCACFDALGIESLKVSPYALREGVLHDLLGRIDNEDPRSKTVEAFVSRYGVDRGQAERVKSTALTAFDKIAEGMYLRPIHRQLLGWAAELHETGLGISHSRYQLHSGYLVENSDMAGFTRQEQLFLAAMVQNHRRSIPAGFADKLPTRLHEPLRMTLFCLRFACILCRSREDDAIPEFRLSGSDVMLAASFPEEWQDKHPLTMFDLRQESKDLQSIGLNFQVSRSVSS
jgi:exopolyphosphatase/guanosine-5'-triphosphate,3'-diphosphate pyrophosphatase